MKFHSVVLALALIGFVFGDFQDCTYTSSDGVYQYDLNGLFGAYTFGTSDETGAIALSFSICGPLSSIVPSIGCEDDSAACFFPTANDANSASINIGNWQNTLFSDSELGSDQGLELVYASPDSNVCDSTGRKFKTSVKLQCDFDSEFVIDSIESPTDCDTVIVLNSSYACPTPLIGGGGEDFQPRARHACNRGVIFALLGFTTLCCCCVCCIRRNRRCALKKRQEQQRAAAAIEMTNAAFKQPTEQQTQPLIPAPVPQFVQYMQQPAYVPQYFYIQPQSIVEEPTQLQNVDNSSEQVAADEQLAKALQAHFDHE